MSLFRGIKRVWKEGKEDENLMREAAGRQPVFNTKCRFRYFGFYDLNSMPFYVINGLSSAPRPAVFKICQECFLASVAPCVPLAKKFVREIKSSKDPEELVNCAFSDPRNETAWRASVQQNNESPFMTRLHELAIMEANLANCPTTLNAAGNSTPNSVVAFRIPRSQNAMQSPYGICEYHFVSGIKGSWMEDEFINASPSFPSQQCIFGAPEISAFAAIALTFAEKSFNFKPFDDWIHACQTLPECTGVIEPTSKRYILQTAQYTTEDRFQICEKCYHLIFLPHSIIKQHFREVSGSDHGERHVCSINDGSVPGYLEAVLKATWKQDAEVLLQHARQQAPIPPCPGAANPTPMRIWYASIVAEHEPITCCEACFHQYIKSTPLFASFQRFAVPNTPESYQCFISLNEVRDLFTSACETGQISTFHTSLLQLTQNLEQDATTAQENAEQVQREAEQPELDLSHVRGTAEQIRQIEALRDEIVRMASDAENKISFANNQISCGSIVASGGMMASAMTMNQGNYTRVSDGHGNWFNNREEAEGSQMQIEGRIKLNEAFALRIEVIRKRGELARLKAALSG